MPRHEDWFDMLYRENAARLFKQAYYVLRDRHLAEDLVEETFLILLSKKDEICNHPNIAGWLSITLKNLIYDELKSAKHRLEIPLTYDEPGAHEDTYHFPLADVLPKGLLPSEREILVLLYEQDLSYEQIAERLNISVLCCRTRAHRAKKHYRALVEKNIKKDVMTSGAESIKK